MMTQIEALVVLGQTLNPDLTAPALLEERLDCAASLSQSAVFPIFACGGDVARCGVAEVSSLTCVEVFMYVFV
jgi:hypothetical protein